MADFRSNNRQVAEDQRDGRRSQVRATDLVPGDVVALIIPRGLCDKDTPRPVLQETTQHDDGAGAHRGWSGRCRPAVHWSRQSSWLHAAADDSFLLLFGMVVVYLVLVKLAKTRFYRIQDLPTTQAATAHAERPRRIRRRASPFIHHPAQEPGRTSSIGEARAAPLMTLVKG